MPLRLDGRRSAANVQVCGWGRPLASHYRADPIVAAPGRRCITTRSKFGSRRSNSSAGGSMPRGRTRAPTAGICRRRKSAGDDRTRSRPAALPRAERHAAASFPLRCYRRGVTGRGWVLPQTANEAPSALADGAEASIAEARGSEKERAAAAGSRSPRSILRRQAHPRMRKSIQQQPTHIQSRPEQP
jgi:hypothetical protein